MAVRQIDTGIKRQCVTGHDVLDYSSKRISKQVVKAGHRLSERNKVIEKNEARSWAKAMNRTIGR